MTADAAEADRHRHAVSWARLQGCFLVVNGLWPLLHMRSFEAIFGPKVDRWLVRTVAGFMVTNGVVLLSTEPTRAGVRRAALVGAGSAATMGAVDVRYAPPGRISRMYLLDAVTEAVFLTGWVVFARHRPAGTRAGHD